MTSRRARLKALQQCAEWLQYCLKLGWPRHYLDQLERLWWEYHDDYGDLIEQRKAKP